ncbi:MAG TPA: glycoside hydrolase family 130 protein [Acidimicrobiia bacterium]
MIPVSHTGIRLTPQEDRVITKPFLANVGAVGEWGQRIQQIADRVLSVPDDRLEPEVELLRSRFRSRHRDIESSWERNLVLAAAYVPALLEVDDPMRRLLLGASFTQEYAIEGAALTNPSAVPIGDGEFILSLRAIGEGHISSIEFRHGRIGADKQVVIDQPGPHATAGVRKEIRHERTSFASKLGELKAMDTVAEMVLELLEQDFDDTELSAALALVAARDHVHPLQADTSMHMFRWLSTSNYDLVFEDEELSERVLFPAGPADSNGMEDARFVRFVDDDGAVTYYATYTAFDGSRVLPQLISTGDFVKFRVSTLHGSCVQNKGMALFPRRIGGRFVALSRHDQMNLHVLWTDDEWQWNTAERLISPHELWESTQIGNCGSPMETPEGWLVITHGVGPMRTYSLGAILLDLDHPNQVLGRLREPLLEPDWRDRDGYVPNVVYSCGALLDRGTVVLPFGIADREVGIALVELSDLLSALI